MEIKSIVVYNSGIIFLLGILGIWKSIPVGFVLKANPVLIIAMTILGSFGGMLILYFLGSKTKEWALSRMNKKGHSKKSGKVNKILDKYGVVGLGIFGPLVMGHLMTMALGMIVVKSERNLLFWTAIGVIIWTICLTLIGSFSIELFNDLIM